MPSGGQPPACFGAPKQAPPRYLSQNESNDVLTRIAYRQVTVQGEVPMTVQSESVAPPPMIRPEARRDSAGHWSFILAINTFAEGDRAAGKTVPA
jgi:hypothetical protein